MTNNIRFLRRVIAMDAIATGAMALGFVAVAGPLSDLFGLPSLTLVCVGLALLPFAAWVGWLAKQSNPPLKLVRLLVGANMIWAADSLLLAFSNWVPLTAIGTEFVVLQAVITLVAATLGMGHKSTLGSEQKRHRLEDHDVLYLISAMLLVAGVIHLLPLPGILGGKRLDRIYGIALSEPNLSILMRHRAVLFGLLGALLVLAAFVPTLQSTALIAGIVSAVTFLWLAKSIGSYNAQLKRVVAADKIAVLCLVVGSAARLLVQV